MKNIIFILFLSFGLCLFAQWQKQGVVSGTINDLKQAQNSDNIFFSTAGGIFNYYLITGGMFTDYSLNLPSGPVIKFDELWDEGTTQRYIVVLHENGVFVKNSSTPWVRADEFGLVDGSNNPIGYKNPRAVAITKNVPETNYDVYLALYGYGIFKRGFLWR